MAKQTIEVQLRTKRTIWAYFFMGAINLKLKQIAEWLSCKPLLAIYLNGELHSYLSGNGEKICLKQ